MNIIRVWPKRLKNFLRHFTCNSPLEFTHFMGKVFTHFSKPAKKFVEECIYGIQASGDTKLSSIVRAIDDDTRPIYTAQLLPGFAELFDTDDG